MPISLYDSIKPKAFYLIGPPASGKGTHGKLIGGLPGFFHFSMGQAFRSLKPRSKSEREELQKVHELTSRGYLAEDELTMRIFDEYLSGLIASRRFRPEEQMLILDGIPRRRSQAEWLDERIELLQVIELVCDEQVILERIQQRALEEGRADDTLEVVKTRLHVYRKELGPMMDYFPADQVQQVKSDNLPATVLRQILEGMDQSEKEASGA